jgi:hypothetical protein
VWACTAPHTTIIHGNSILYAWSRLAWNPPAPQNPADTNPRQLKSVSPLL